MLIFFFQRSRPDGGRGAAAPLLPTRGIRVEEGFRSDRALTYAAMEAYPLHLAMAALVGASLAAVSAFYMHGQTVDQILDLAKAMDRNRLDSTAFEDAGGGEIDDSKQRNSSRRRGRKGNRKRGGRGSASPPAISGPSGGGAEEEKSSLPVLEMPIALPRHHKLPEGAPISDFSPGEW
ncbi:hypothetical protein M569_02896 [Genlisea aurea]|uniref:Uncharacterized protein n=1 Tax=Genlisea aurea TaxID=192259 RepID=S8E7S2_9LAMI|nr:hypothetical protein M569_02896 [Genlisea aurea]